MNLEALAVPAILTVFGVVGWLLRNKDAQQEAQIKELKDTIQVLFKKHDIDVKELHNFRISIAEGHYKKTELDFKFEKLEHAITNSFDKLGAKFDELTKALINHIDTEGKK